MRYLLFILLLIATSCVHNNGNIGPLMGRWQLQTFSDSSIDTTVNNLFLSFQGEVTEIRQINNYTESVVYGNFIQDGDHLLLYFSLGETNLCNQFGLDGLSDTLSIDYLSSKKLTLSKGDKSWQLRKF